LGKCVKLKYNINSPDRNIYCKQLCDCRTVPKDGKFPQTTTVGEQFSSVYAFIQILSPVVLKTVILHKLLKRRFPLCPAVTDKSNQRASQQLLHLSLLREHLCGRDDKTARSMGSQTLNHDP